MVRKLGALIIGVPVVLLGIVLLPAPGPGTLVIIAGLAILATEFPWAHRHMTRLKSGARHVVDRFRRPADDAIEAVGNDPTHGTSHR